MAEPYDEIDDEDEIDEDLDAIVRDFRRVAGDAPDEEYPW